MDYVMTEKQILTSISHPFIMKMHYSFTTKNYINIVLDFCPGGELFFHIVKKRRFSENVARFYIAEIILAIEHLHDNNILYRDLKPENVLLDYDGHIKLTDFGLSALNFTKNSVSNIFCGSPEYMPPEMIQKQNYNRMIDYYAIGALLYEMIAGIPPFYSRRRKELFYNIVKKEVKFFKEFSNPARDLIYKLLRKNYKKRLGFTNGMAEVKNHPFFKDLDWRRLYRKQIHPPYKPSMRDINFSSEFTSIPVTFNFEEEVTRNERKFR
jgi:serine/threonine protein kinase